MMPVEIRRVQAGDAEALFAMMNALDQETSFMMYEPGERPQNVERLEAAVAQAAGGEDYMAVAVDGKEIVGFLSAQRGGLRRVRHTAYIVMGVRAAYRGQGVGTALFGGLDGWARECGVTRLELTVMQPNAAAKRLYEKHGFEAEGVRRKSMLVNGEYVDEYYMAKLL